MRAEFSIGKASHNSPYIPKVGEVVMYDADGDKNFVPVIGDGKSSVHDLLPLPYAVIQQKVSDLEKEIERLKNINMKIKLLSKDAKVPFRASPSDAGADLCSVENVVIGPLERKMISTGLSTEIPEGYYGRVAPRSGLAVKNGIDVLAGVVDSTYRGEIKVILFNTDKQNNFEIKSGDRIAQLIIEKHFNFEFEISEDLSYTERGTGGFGSTGVG